VHNRAVLLAGAILPAATVAAVNDRSVAYDLVLLAHVLAALAGTVAVVVAAGFALTLRAVLRREGRVSEAVVRYYRPGVNWVGRVLFAVPVLGAALVGMGGGQWRWSDAWVLVGLGVWAAVAVVAEALVWPGERVLQEVVGALGSGAVGDGPVDAPGDVRDRCLAVALAGFGCAAALVAVAVVMVAKP